MTQYISNENVNYQQQNQNNNLNLVENLSNSKLNSSNLIDFSKIKKPSEVQISLEYDLFISHPNNRKAETKNLERLRNAVEEHNLLHEQDIKVIRSHPSLINSDHPYYIVDGNHRYIISREKGLPIYFKVLNDWNVSDMSLINFNLSKWATPQFLEHYVSLGKEEYIKFKKFAEDYKFTVYTALPLTRKAKDRVGINEVFRKGNFIFHNEREIRQWITSAMEFLDKCIEFGLTKRNNYQNKAFFDGYSRLMQHPKFNQSKMLGSVEKKGASHLATNSQSSEYYNNLKYNFLGVHKEQE